MSPRICSSLLTVMVLVWHSRVGQSVEVCCCPDLTLSLTAVQSNTTKSVHNGFMVVAKQGSAVTFDCDLGDKDHEAVKSVVYKFHKTSDLSSIRGRPISLSLHGSTSKEICTDKEVSQSTCTLDSVGYSKQADYRDSLDSADNHFYQCSAVITLVDGSVVKLWSHTVKLDVYYPPNKVQSTKYDPLKVPDGRGAVRLACNLPESNPRTKARWWFKQLEEDTWQIIDIPNDKVRGERLIIEEDEITLDPTYPDERGTLLVMVFDHTVDVGMYKCEGVYDTVLDDTDTSFDIAQYELTWRGDQDIGSLRLKGVSYITEPKLLNQDSVVNFTFYAQDAPGRGNYGNVTYTWQFVGGDPSVDVDFDQHPGLRLSNYGRTLTVTDILTYRDNEFQCVMTRYTSDKSGRVDQSQTFSNEFSIRRSGLVIAPKFLSVPLTSRKCENKGENLRTAPSRAYMMNTPDLAAENPRQVLVGADSWKYYINDYRLLFLRDDPEGNFDNATAAGLTEEQLARKLPEKYNDRCIYWQYMRAQSRQYQIWEVMKTSRMDEGMGSGCQDLDSSFCDKVTAVLREGKGEKTVAVSFAEDVELTAQCLVTQLVDTSDNVLGEQRFKKTADSCSDRDPPRLTFHEDPDNRFPARTSLKIRIAPEGMKGCEIAITSGGDEDEEDHSLDHLKDAIDDVKAALDEFKEALDDLHLPDVADWQ